MLNPRDRLHRRAIDAGYRYHGAVVATEYVLMELGDSLSASGRDSFMGLCEGLEREPPTKMDGALDHGGG